MAVSAKITLALFAVSVAFLVSAFAFMPYDSGLPPEPGMPGGVEVSSPLNSFTGFAVHQSYAGFAEPASNFSLNNRNFTFASADASDVLRINVSDDAVYTQAYLSYDGSSWSPVTLSGTVLGGSWLTGTSNATLYIRPANFTLNSARTVARRNFVVVYSCSRNSTSWDCHDGWQIWQFNATLNASVPCTPTCTCASSACIGSTCPDGCGGTCSGTYAGDCSCVAATCTGSTCSNGCSGSCAGTLAPDCGTRTCGEAPNGCGNSSVCGTCDSGYSCQSGTCVSSGAGNSTTFAMNLGGVEFTAADGTVYAAHDNAYVTSYSRIFTDAGASISGTTDDELYRSQVQGDTDASESIEIQVPVQSPATYSVTLHMAEIESDAATRNYAISFEGADYPSSDFIFALDLRALVGMRQSYVLRHNVTVNDGTLNIRVDEYGASDDIHIAAVRVVPAVSVPQQCTPSCACAVATCVGSTCSDGCGGTCDGTLAPSCTGMVCGSDGCGGSCGTCSSGYTCQGGTCVVVPSAVGFVVNHEDTDLSDIPECWVNQAKSTLHIAYAHTSHGSQIISGMDALESYGPFGTEYAWSATGGTGILHLEDYDGNYGTPFPGSSCSDLSICDYDSGGGMAGFYTPVRNFLNNPSNSDINVIVWSWCSIYGHDAQRYVDTMNQLESEYPDVKFVYLTGHTEGSAGNSNVFARNTLIRNHVAANDAILFDFADIESWDPSGNDYTNLGINDGTDYTSGTLQYWSSNWLAANPTGELADLTAIVNRNCAHSPESGEPTAAGMNCVMKGRASWHLWARLAGWNGQPDDPCP